MTEDQAALKLEQDETMKRHLKEANDFIGKRARETGKFKDVYEEVAALRKDRDFWKAKATSSELIAGTLLGLPGAIEALGCSPERIRQSREEIAAGNWISLEELFEGLKSKNDLKDKIEKIGTLDTRHLGAQSCPPTAFHVSERKTE